MPILALATIRVPSSAALVVAVMGIGIFMSCHSQGMTSESTKGDQGMKDHQGQIQVMLNELVLINSSDSIKADDKIRALHLGMDITAAVMLMSHDVLQSSQSLINSIVSKANAVTPEST